MQYVKFGNAGIKVSRLCLGAMDFPDRCEETEAIRIVHHALDQGINFIDTADAYGRGSSEVLLGKALPPEKRDHVIIATKLWVKMYPQDPNGGGCSRFHIMRAVEDSLRRLNTDRIDLYQLHHPDPETPVEEVITTMDALVKQGKLRYWGVANHYAWQMAHMLGIAAKLGCEPLVSIQCRYNILDRVIENETIPFTKRFNIAIMAYGPLDGGVLTGKYKKGKKPPAGSRLDRAKSIQARLTKDMWDVLDELRVMADKYGIGMNQLAMAWIIAQPEITTPILGGAVADHFEPMYSIFEVKIEPEDLQRIDQMSERYRYLPFCNQHVVEGPPLAVNWW
jgi:aryl-alcohol dehydrogenase-like predicted oxidoreductase